MDDDPLEQLDHMRAVLHDKTIPYREKIKMAILNQDNLMVDDIVDQIVIIGMRENYKQREELRIALASARKRLGEVMRVAQLYDDMSVERPGKLNTDGARSHRATLRSCAEVIRRTVIGDGK
jgi:hypothetical protein